jgi:O-acetyl-ADP-ribose deacetylase (regulator of RNase III)
MKIELVVGNLVRQPDVDAIVNSANMNLRFGSGVAGAIHSAAGPQLEEYCRQFVPLGLGEAVISPGFDLPNPFVIHVRAASYINDDSPKEHLDRAVRSVLAVAHHAGVRTIAMPALGTGVFKFPPALAAQIVLKALLDPSYSPQRSLVLVRICLADDQMKSVFERQHELAAGRYRMELQSRQRSLANEP